MQTQHAPIIFSVILSGVSILPTLVLQSFKFAPKFIWSYMSGSNFMDGGKIWENINMLDFFGKIGVLLRDLKSYLRI